MHTFFYSNTSEFAGNLQECLMIENTKQPYRIYTSLVGRHNYSIPVLVHGCGVSQYPQFYDIIKKIYQMLPRPYKGSYPGDKGRQFL